MNRLLSLKASQLKSLAIWCAAARSGTKPVVVESILESVAESQVPALTWPPSKSRSIVSVDMGLRNIAICKMTIPPIQNPRSVSPIPVVSQWSVFELEGWNVPGAFDQPQFSQLTLNLVKRVLSSANGSPPDVVLIEQQRLRSAGSRSVLEVIAQINVLEGMLHAILLSTTSCYIESVSPAKVTAYWTPPQAESRSDGKKLSMSQRYSKTKKAKVGVVTSWLSQPMAPVSFEPGVVQTFHDQVQQLKKQDDLCDSLLQGVAWSQWQSNRYALRNTLQGSNEKEFERLISSLDGVSETN